MRSPCSVRHELAEKTHLQHSRGVDRGHYDPARVNRIDVNGIKVARRSGIPGELNAIDRRLCQRGQLIAHVDAFEVEPTGGHQIASLLARTTSVRRALN